jgi:hypothetical protein
MHVSFTHRLDWFVFDDDGKTIQRGFRTKADALAWIVQGRVKRRSV